MEKLSKELESALKYANVEIPEHISQNLNKELRAYQSEAIKRFLLQRQSPSTNHLMFNMATGSGKTLVMAALILDCYKRGYRNFVFFVHSTSILEKTKANFCDRSSSKYLFADEINIDGKRVEVKAINNFIESSESAINIYFSTIQGLFSLFKEEKENSLTLEDLENYEIVYLADEAHHLNANTKNKSEKEDKESWESVIQKAFESHEKNIMLEFTATIPNDKKVLEKYNDKIVYEYALKQFYKDGFSKRIFLEQYGNTMEQRMLGACLSSLYRQLLAINNDIALKPVILFKNDLVKNSKNNQNTFNAMLENLSADDISNFYNMIGEKSELFKSSLSFFKKFYGSNYINKIAEHIKQSFKDIYQLNANEDREVEANQIKLNTLEDKDNDVRVIFAVNKLNEGWDVLNLFDIVRLDQNTPKKNEDTTTQEAQLIGRGARYYPFGDGENKYKRKHDDDLTNELAVLEKLSYHTINNVEYIANITNELAAQGITPDNEMQGILELEPSKRAKEITKKNSIFYVGNTKYNQSGTLFDTDSIKSGLEKIEISYRGNSVGDSKEVFADGNTENTQSKDKEQTLLKQAIIGKNIEYRFFQKAMNKLSIDLPILQAYNKEITNKREFYDKVLAPLELSFDKKQDFSDCEVKLDIATYILSNYKELMSKKRKNYCVTDFEVKELTNVGARQVVRKGKFNSSNEMEFNKVSESPYDWLYYHKYSWDSELEKDFLDFIEQNKDKIDAKFAEWIIMRNEGFEEFKLYDNRMGDTYGNGFEPDFILFGKPKDNANLDYLSAEIILESKGDGFVLKDKWKEELILKELNNKVFNTYKSPTETANINIYALPFFISKSDENFKKEFNNFFGNN
ncbi:DEAD/DEAH box helicase family protein [Campylobacter sp.]|uniref:DEAD/DEAH box helicase family protein n=1 Tax=Campylobacter sp. TaxID=205 RepID=UPI002AA71EB8|nr:DEAD/DEAH box helicase family protein [Campylobacter sp.]MCI6662021.1 DEAD/DEAH box helicase family protein [Campylobacter sp.]MCI7549745.1 DEAD/DEAH box helicase family protein [Campylobacter sp.]